jgi:hypothetical protein
VLLLILAVMYGLCPGGCGGFSYAAELEYDPDVIIVMKDQMFQVIKGEGVAADVKDPRFSLVPGENIVLMLKNEDRIAHEFVSPLFQHVDLQFSGRATLVYTHTAAGLRVDPSETVVLRFEIPTAPAYDLFHFWCNLHGKIYGDSMRGEVLILAPRKAAAQ